MWLIKCVCLIWGYRSRCSANSIWSKISRKRRLIFLSMVFGIRILCTIDCLADCLCCSVGDTSTNVSCLFFFSVFWFCFCFFFFSCSVVRRSCLVFAPLVDLILVTGFLFWQPLVVFWVSGWIFIFISNYVSVTINSAILWPQVFTYINCCLGSQPRGFDKRFILDSYRDNMNLWNASRPAITKIYSKIFMWN